MPSGLTYTLPADLYGSQKTVDAQTGRVVNTSAPDLNALLPGVTVTARRPVTQQQQKVTVRPTTANEMRDAVGTIKPLEKSNYDFKSLKFPSNLGDYKSRHWIKFTPNVQVASRYKVSLEGSGAGTMGIADSNRFNLQGQLASNQRAIADDVASNLTATLAAYKGVTGVANGLEAPAETPGAALFNTLIGGAAGLAVGAFSGQIVKEIKLGRKTRRAAGSIALYMPDTVNVTVVNDYDQVSMTQALGMAGLAAQAGGSVIEQMAKNGIKSLGNLAATPGTAEVGGFLAEKTGLFGNGITDALLFSAGYAQNPQVELLFKTIQNREFLFDFKFVPRDEREAAEIIDIIKQFRFFAAPEIPANGTGRYFVPPSEFDIDFMIGSDRNTKIPRISTCVLQGIDVNYGSAGQWTAFKDGMPVEISMQLRFKEVEIMHKELIRQGF